MDLGSPVGAEQAGRRPALIVSTDRHNQGRAPVVLVVPITSRDRGIPTHVVIEASDGGLDRRSVAMCDNLRALDRRRLVGRLGSLSPPVLNAVAHRLRLLLEL